MKCAAVSKNNYELSAENNGISGNEQKRLAVRPSFLTAELPNHPHESHIRNGTSSVCLSRLCEKWY
jgi:hypothetical protein